MCLAKNLTSISTKDPNSNNRIDEDKGRDGEEKFTEFKLVFLINLSPNSNLHANPTVSAKNLNTHACTHTSERIDCVLNCESIRERENTLQNTTNYIN